MKTGAIYKLGLASLAAVILGLGIAYATKPGNCPPVRDYRLDRSNHVGIVYGAWMERVDSAVVDYKNGKIAYIMPTGNPWEIESIRTHAVESGVPENRIIDPVRGSRDTFGNITATSETIKQKGLPNSRRHYSSDKHIPRIRMIVEKLGDDPENDDGYVPVQDGYDNKLFRIPNSREWVGCIRDRIRN